jgi:hypothetical protein
VTARFGFQCGGALVGAMLAVALTADRVFGAALFASCRTLFRG